MPERERRRQPAAIIDLSERRRRRQRETPPQSDTLARVIYLPTPETVAQQPTTTHAEMVAYIQARMGIKTKVGAERDAVETYYTLLKRLETGTIIFGDKSGHFTEISFKPPTK